MRQRLSAAQPPSSANPATASSSAAPAATAPSSAAPAATASSSAVRAVSASFCAVPPATASSSAPPHSGSFPQTPPRGIPQFITPDVRTARNLRAAQSVLRSKGGTIPIVPLRPAPALATPTTGPTVADPVQMFDAEDPRSRETIKAIVQEVLRTLGHEKITVTGGRGKKSRRGRNSEIKAQKALITQEQDRLWKVRRSQSIFNRHHQVCVRSKQYVKYGGNCSVSSGSPTSCSTPLRTKRMSKPAVMAREVDPARTCGLTLVKVFLAHGGTD
jgi:hypothetical protein